MTEAETRKALIDNNLRIAGWNVDDLSLVVKEFDILVNLPENAAEPRSDYDGHQFSDYVLLGKELKPQLPLPVRLVGLRLDKIEKAIDSGYTDIANREIAKLRLQIAALPKESVVIKEAAGSGVGREAELEQ